MADREIFNIYDRMTREEIVLMLMLKPTFRLPRECRCYRERMAEARAVFKKIRAEGIAPKGRRSERCTTRHV